MARAILWAIWHYAHAIEFRFFQYYEFYLLKRSGIDLPRSLLREIWKRPGQSEDWIQLARFLHPDEPILLIDIGANVGDFTAEFLSIYKNGRAVCFEPVESNFSALQARFPPDGTVECHRCALSDFDGKADIHLGVSNTLSSLETYATEAGAAYGVTEDSYKSVESVTCRTLDSFAIDPAGAAVFIKVDVQGHEARAIAGGARTFAKAAAAIVECSFANEYRNLDPSFPAVTAALAKADLYPVIFQEYGRQWSNYGFERDVIFVRKDRLPKIWFDNYGLSRRDRDRLR